MDLAANFQKLVIKLALKRDLIVGKRTWLKVYLSQPPFKRSAISLQGWVR